MGSIYLDAVSEKNTLLIYHSNTPKPFAENPVRFLPPCQRGQHHCQCSPQERLSGSRGKKKGKRKRRREGKIVCRANLYSRKIFFGAAMYAWAWVHLRLSRTEVKPARFGARAEDQPQHWSRVLGKLGPQKKPQSFSFLSILGNFSSAISLFFSQPHTLFSHTLAYSTLLQIYCSPSWVSQLYVACPVLSLPPR